MQWLNEEASSFKILLKRLYNQEDLLMHLFLCLEVESLAGLQRELKDKFYKFGDELQQKVTQEFTSVPTSTKVWDTFLKSEFKNPMTVILHLLLSMSVEQGTGLIKRCNGQKNVKDKPPDQGRFEYKLKICTSEMVWSILLESDLNFIMTTIIHLILSLSVERGTGLSKSTQRREDLSKTHTILTSARVQIKLFKSDSNISMTTIMRLVLFLNFEKGIGLNQRCIGVRNVKEKPPDQNTRRLELEGFTREHKSGSNNQRRDPMGINDFANQDENGKGLFQLKEEPPDFPNSVSFQGKFLTSHKPQRTNLLYLCVGEQVLRSKLFEGGGYDEDMTSMNLGQLEPEKTQPGGPTEAAQDSPYLPVLEGYLAVVTSGVTKEITASCQDPDQTSNTSRPSSRRVTKNYREVTMKIQDLPCLTTTLPHPLPWVDFHHLLYPPPPHFIPSYHPFPPTSRRSIQRPLHHLLSIFPSPPLLHLVTPPPTAIIYCRDLTYLISTHHHQFHKSSTPIICSNGYNINRHHTFHKSPHQHNFTDSPHLHDLSTAPLLYQAPRFSPHNKASNG